MSLLKKVLLVTFELSQRGKSATCLAAGSLVSACQSHDRYGSKFTISHI